MLLLDGLVADHPDMIDAATIAALATLLTALGRVVWAIRRPRG